MTANPAPSMNYHMLASLISLQPGFAIFRRFLEPTARDLLRLQGEITNLERDLQIIIAADRASGDEEKEDFEFCIASLKGPPHPSLEKGLQWEKQVELSHKLETYSQSLSPAGTASPGRLDALANSVTHEQGTALLQYKQLCELPSANKLGLANLREVLDINGADRGFPRGLEKTIWSEKNETDLTSLMDPCPEMDVCSRWIHSHLLRWYHNTLGHRFHDPISLVEKSVQTPITNYSDRKLIATVNAISTILASLLPAISILALNFIHDQLARVAAVVAFCFLFSVVLTLVTNAGRADCFAATAAFAAVQVVFVSTNIYSQQVN
jgi:hypothetical protein